MKDGLAVNLMIDSGAYSSWRRQIPLTVEQYIDFCHQYGDIINRMVNLDVIPGRWGKIPSPAEVEESARKGAENAAKMVKAGLNPMPVYHMGERRYWLDKMIDEGYDYVGISPANDRNTKQKMEWLDEVFGYLCGSKGYPHVRTHGFGVTSLPILFRYPWGTVDSLTWIAIAAYGGILVPRADNDGKPDYNLAPQTIHISSNAGAASYENGSHWKSLGPKTQEYVRQYVESLGFTIEEMFASYLPRTRFNLKFFQQVETHHQIAPFYERRSGLFGSGASSPRGYTENKWGRFIFVATQNTSKEIGQILTDYGARHRLLSFYYFLDGKGLFDLREYCRTGLIVPKNGKKSTELPELTIAAERST